TIKDFVKTKKKTKILWIFSILAFTLSAIIDNLTATIVLISILQKVVKEREIRLYYAGLIIIAANAGGAWSPIGDVTTTMLWIGKNVTTVHLIGFLFIPFFLYLAVLVFMTFFLLIFRVDLDIKEVFEEKKKFNFSSKILYLGLGTFLFLPIFKMITHLP